MAGVGTVWIEPGESAVGVARRRLGLRRLVGSEQARVEGVRSAVVCAVATVREDQRRRGLSGPGCGD